MHTKEENLYAKLGVPVDATPDELRHAYREAARHLHPDTNNDPQAHEKFIEITQAYEILADPGRRAAYDQSLPADQKAPPPVTFKTIYSCSSLPALSESQRFYALIEITVSPETKSDEYLPVNTCLVIDSSTSMQGVRLDAVKTAAIEILRSIRQKDIISLVSFNDFAQVIVPGIRDQDPREITTAIRNLSASGATEIFKGLKAGYEEVRRNIRPGYINHIILMTDGHTYGDEPACLDLAQQAAEYGIIISTLGIGDKWNDSFLDKLASTTGGNCRFISKTADIDKYINISFYSVEKSYTRSIVFDGTLGTDVKLDSIYRLLPEAAPLAVEMPVQAGYLPRGSSLSLLLEFSIDRIPQDLKRFKVADIKFVFDIPSRAIPTYTLRIPLELPVGTQPPNYYPAPEILQAISRLTLYRIQERAKEEAASGKIRQATVSLKYLATNLLSLGEIELAKKVAKEVALLESSNAFSEEGKKAIKYGTRSLNFEQRIPE